MVCRPARADQRGGTRPFRKVPEPCEHIRGRWEEIMRRPVTILALVALVICIAQVLYLYVGRSARPVVNMPPQTTAAEALPTGLVDAAGKGRTLELLLHRSETVDFVANEGSLAELTTREREDQYRDWLLFVSVAALNHSAEDYSRIFFDLPATRQGYMRPMGVFEFGETRSRFIGNGAVVALIPAGRSDTDRKD